MLRNLVQDSQGGLKYLSEYDYTFEHRPGTKMLRTVALSSSVNVIWKEAFLSNEVIHCEQETDELCSKYRRHENFCTN
jgi:hypothetical protein